MAKIAWARHLAARDAGRAQERVEALLAVLEAHGIGVPAAARQRIAAASAEELHGWIVRAATAAGLEEVLI